mmetsp:Transcript_37512/g.87394  ORF Transcript_37512/g.87394 Transcript_37512/m.87394 type:complete len:222 (-) Transcript_37512:8014-8679(-)
MPTPRCSTWPAASSPRWAGSCWPPAGRLTRRRWSSAAPAASTRSPASTRWPISPAPRCCTAAARPSSPWGQARGLSAIRIASAPRPIKSLLCLRLRRSRLPSPPRALHDPRRHRILHPLQVHRLRRRLPGRLLPRRPELPDDRPGRVHRLRRLHPRVPGQRHHAGGGCAGGSGPHDPAQRRPRQEVAQHHQAQARPARCRRVEGQDGQAPGTDQVMALLRP